MLKTFNSVNTQYVSCLNSRQALHSVSTTPVTLNREYSANIYIGDICNVDVTSPNGDVQGYE